MAAPPSYEQASYPTKDAYPVPQPAQPYPQAAQPAYPAGAYPAPQTAPVAPAQPAVQTNTTVVVTSTSTALGPYPVTTTCPRCANTVTTRITQTPGTFAWLLCLFLALIGCWMGCCLIPFCLPDMQDTTHHCPNCAQLIGTHRRM